MDKILFSQRLSCLIKEKYRTLSAFARAYDAIYNPGALCNAANNPQKGTINTIKKYVSPKSKTIPSLDKIDNMCQLLDCDIDYLLGKIDAPKRIHQEMLDQCGLSNAATDQLVYWKTHGGKYTETLNYILVSANFDNALYHAGEVMRAKPIYIGLMNIYNEWTAKTYSQPRPADGYPSGDGLRERLQQAETKYEIERLRLNEFLTYLVSELEDISMDKKTKKGEQ